MLRCCRRRCLCCYRLAATRRPVHRQETADAGFLCLLLLQGTRATACEPSRRRRRPRRWFPSRTCMNRRWLCRHWRGQRVLQREHRRCCEKVSTKASEISKRHLLVPSSSSSSLLPPPVRARLPSEDSSGSACFSDAQRAGGGPPEAEPEGCDAEDAARERESAGPLAAPAGASSEAGTAVSFADSGAGTDSTPPGPGPGLVPERVAMPPRAREEERAPAIESRARNKRRQAARQKRETGRPKAEGRETEN
jgi:hypothetical protein